MKNSILATTSIVALFIAIPFIIIETVIKLLLSILYILIIVLISIFYPIIKVTKYNLNWLDAFHKYATTYKKGYIITRYVYNLWKIED